MLGGRDHDFFPGELNRVSSRADEMTGPESRAIFMCIQTHYRERASSSVRLPGAEPGLRVLPDRGCCR